MPLKCRFTGSERKWRGLRKGQKWNRVQEDKMSADVAFRLWKIVVIRKARNQKGVPLAGSARKETVTV